MQTLFLFVGLMQVNIIFYLAENDLVGTSIDLGVTQPE